MALAYPAPAHDAPVSGRGSDLAIEVHRDLHAVADEWRSIQADAAGGPHQTLEWTQVWMSAHPARHSIDPAIALCRDGNGNSVAILPFAIRHHFGCTLLEWLAADQGNYSSGLYERAFWSSRRAPDGGAFLESLLAALPSVDVVHLADHPTDLHGLSNPLATLPGVSAASAGYAFPIGQDWNAEYERRFNSRFRRGLNRNERRLAEHGPVRLIRIDDVPRRLATLNIIFDQKRQWFAERGIKDAFADKGMHDFYRTLVRLPASGTGLAVRVYQLTAGDDVVAASVDLLHRNCYYGLITSTTAGEQRKYGPGNILFRRLVEQLAEEGVQRFDCGAGENEQKLRWCTERRERRHTVVPVTEKGQFYAKALTAGLLAKSQIKRSPWLWRLAKTVRRRRPAP